MLTFCNHTMHNNIIISSVLIMKSICKWVVLLVTKFLFLIKSQNIKNDLLHFHPNHNSMIRSNYYAFSVRQGNQGRRIVMNYALKLSTLILLLSTSNVSKNIRVRTSTLNAWKIYAKTSWTIHVPFVPFFLSTSDLYSFVVAWSLPYTAVSLAPLLRHYQGHQRSNSVN